VASDDYCYLTTTGRRTGRPHRIEIWYARDGDVVYLLAGGGHRSDWVRNVVAEPAARVEIDGTVHSARARVVDGGEEAERARAFVFDKYAPRSESDLTEWRRRALPVAVELVAAPQRG
jgi:deazaflavin-dependent oxidoreductase (nitroreductase family)